MREIIGIYQYCIVVNERRQQINRLHRLFLDALAVRDSVDGSGHRVMVVIELQIFPILISGGAY